MCIRSQNPSEVQSTIQRTVDVVTVKLDNVRIRQIVSDESADVEKRSMANELAAARTSVGLLLALGAGDATALRAAVLDTLESKCSSFALDDEGDRNSTADAIVAALVGGGR